jgi:hypothetical protein
VGEGEGDRSGGSEPWGTTRYRTKIDSAVEDKVRRTVWVASLPQRRWGWDLRREVVRERERVCVCVCECVREREARRGKGGVEVRRFEGF